MYFQRFRIPFRPIRAELSIQTQFYRPWDPQPDESLFWNKRGPEADIKYVK